jgi:hypothetical protein
MLIIKKVIYISLFGFLGLLLSAILHAVIEAPTLWLITSDLDKYGDSFVWQNWAMLHRYIGGLIWIVGLVGGLYAGFKYWRIIYIEGKRSKFNFNQASSR